MKCIIIESVYKRGSGSGNEIHKTHVLQSEDEKDEKIVELKDKITKMNSKYDHDIFTISFQVFYEKQFNKLPLSTLLKGNISLKSFLKLM